MANTPVNHLETTLRRLHSELSTYKAYTTTTPCFSTAIASLASIPDPSTCHHEPSITFHAIKLTLCELQQTALPIPPACLDITMAAATSTSPTTDPYKKCTKGLAKSPQLWTSYSTTLKMVHLLCYELRRLGGEDSIYTLMNRIQRVLEVEVGVLVESGDLREQEELEKTTMDIVLEMQRSFAGVLEFIEDERRILNQRALEQNAAIEKIQKDLVVSLMDILEATNGISSVSNSVAISVVQFAQYLNSTLEDVQAFAYTTKTTVNNVMQTMDEFENRASLSVEKYIWSLTRGEQLSSQMMNQMALNLNKSILETERTAVIVGMLSGMTDSLVSKFISLENQIDSKAEAALRNLEYISNSSLVLIGQHDYMIHTIASYWSFTQNIASAVQCSFFDILWDYGLHVTLWGITLFVGSIWTKKRFLLRGVSIASSCMAVLMKRYGFSAKECGIVSFGMFAFCLTMQLVVLRSKGKKPVPTSKLDLADSFNHFSQNGSDQNQQNYQPLLNLRRSPRFL
ncbi:hypothetical protein BDR26DRAFT_1006433 [Obelidium mucronatum]|nr:hypothetical protein BDR26DRAFT_1006433 [Obelidium mucronatum]